MPVTLYGINKYKQVFKSYVRPDEVEYYVTVKGLSTEKPVEKEEVKSAEKPAETVVEKPKKGRPKKEESD